jgi:predicted nucleic acid-binding protein
MKHCFVDTNIILDLLLDRKPHSKSASLLFDMAVKGKVKLYMSAITVHNLYYILQKLKSHHEAMSILKKIQTFITILDTTASDVQEALQSNPKDFEDALQIQTSQRHSKINAIITRNTKDFKNSSLPIWTADQAMKWIGGSVDR